jgi:hypothetical protein
MNKINGAISIGSQVTSIGEDAFYDNTAKEIHLLSA